MGGLGKLLAAGISAGAMMAGVIGNAERKYHEQKREAFAPTNRKPSVKRLRKMASTRRATARETAKAKFDKQIRKEREIGVDPIFLHAQTSRIGGSTDQRKKWLKASHAWDKAHG